MKIKINILGEDTKNVAKVILIDKESRVLFLKRSNYVKKFAGEWDLPGGHVKKNESLLDGVKRETKEETKLCLNNPLFFKKVENISFFHENYVTGDIKISDEHVEYKFLSKRELNKDKKFEKIALEVIEERENESK